MLGKQLLNIFPGPQTYQTTMHLYQRPLPTEKNESTLEMTRKPVRGRM